MAKVVAGLRQAYFSQSVDKAQQNGFMIRRGSERHRFSHSQGNLEHFRVGLVDDSNAGKSELAAGSCLDQLRPAIIPTCSRSSLTHHDPV